MHTRERERGEEEEERERVGRKNTELQCTPVRLFAQTPGDYDDVGNPFPMNFATSARARAIYLRRKVTRRDVTR